MDDNNLQLEKIKQGLTKSTAEVFDEVSHLNSISGLWLCGGTGQSIQMAHRLSEDLDFELLSIRRNKQKLQIGTIITELKAHFQDARLEILSNEHFEVYLNQGKVKLSFFNPQNPVPELRVGLVYNNIQVPTLQELLGMKVFTTGVRSLFRDYYDIYCLLEKGCSLSKAINYAGAFSHHEDHSKNMYSRLLASALYARNDDFKKMNPSFDISPEEIGEYIHRVIIEEKSGISPWTLFQDENGKYNFHSRDNHFLFSDFGFDFATEFENGIAEVSTCSTTIEVNEDQTCNGIILENMEDSIDFHPHI